MLQIDEFSGSNQMKLEELVNTHKWTLRNVWSMNINTSLTPNMPAVSPIDFSNKHSFCCLMNFRCPDRWTVEILCLNNYALLSSLYFHNYFRFLFLNHVTPWFMTRKLTIEIRCNKQIYRIQSLPCVFKIYVFIYFNKYRIKYFSYRLDYKSEMSHAQII